MLWLYQRTFFGRLPGMSESAGSHSHGGHSHDDDHGHNHDHEHGHDRSHDDHGFPDLSTREWAAILPMIALMVWMGIAPMTFLPSISASDTKTLEQSKTNVEFQVKAEPVKAAVEVTGAH